MQVRDFDREVDELKVEVNELEDELNHLVPVKDLMGRVHQRMDFWLGDKDLAHRLGMKLRDFGDWKHWSDKTPDSTWSVTYHVDSHVFDFDSTWKEDEYYKYPDWLWYDSDPPNPKPGALVNLMRDGFPETFPLGEFSARGYRASFSRLHDHLVEAGDVFFLLRKVFDIWPV